MPELRGRSFASVCRTGDQLPVHGRIPPQRHSTANCGLAARRFSKRSAFSSNVPPTVGASKTTYRRLKAIRKSNLEQAPAQMRVLYQSICEGTDSLRKELSRTESLGGEGLMLRQPDSLYEFGRSATLLKVKTFHDAEAVVVGHQPGKGRHKGRLGAVLVALPNGTQFSVGTGFSDAQRELPPAIGTAITFRYQELTDGGVPRFPSFVRERRETTASPAKRK